MRRVSAKLSARFILCKGEDNNMNMSVSGAKMKGGDCL